VFPPNDLIDELGRVGHPLRVAHLSIPADVLPVRVDDVGIQAIPHDAEGR
jgi:hypothetical protein